MEILKTPQKLFLVLCLFWGILFALISPPFTAADECSHFWKIYAVSEGHFSAKKLTTNIVNGVSYPKIHSMTGEYIPIGMVKAGYKNIHTRFRITDKTSFQTTKEILNYPLEKNMPVFNTFPLPSYTLMSYFPGFIFMKIMAAANINPGLMLYVLRLVSLFTYTALIYFAIKITPVKKWLFFVLALTPTMIYQASSVNTDGLTVGLGFLFLCYTFYLAFDENIKTLTNKQLVVYIFIALYFLLCKFAYLPILLIYFLIPQGKFKDKKTHLLVFSFLILYAFLIAGALFLANSYLSGGSNDTMNNALAFWILLHKPLIVIKSALFTTVTQFRFFAGSFIGLFGWGESVIPAYVSNLYYLVILFIALYNTPEDLNGIEFTLQDKLNFIFICSGFYAIIFTILFLIFHINSKGLISCFWGRYFIPVAPLFFLVIQNKILKIKTNLPIFVCIFVINFVILFSLVIMASRFYL